MYSQRCTDGSKSVPTSFTQSKEVGSRLPKLRKRRFIHDLCWTCCKITLVFGSNSWYLSWKGQDSYPLDRNSPCRGERASHQDVFTQVRQRENLNWASQLKSLDQQIFSTMSSPDSALVRQRLERPSLVKAPLSVKRQSAYMLAVHLVTVRLLAATGRLPRLVRRKVAMLRAFSVGF